MARKPQVELPESTVERITVNIRSMVDDRVDRGVDLMRSMHCDSCGEEKYSKGSTIYGAYKLCNDCLLEVTLAFASGQIETVVDFMTHRIDGPDLPILEDERERSSVTRNALHGRDKFMPSNEPA